MVDELGQAIAAGDLPYDSQLVPEEIGEQFGVSRTVVREAFKVLETKGMVEARPKTGTRVLPVQRWDLLDRDVIGWRVAGPARDSQLRELVDLRTAVEPLAARRCAQARDADAVAALRLHCAAMLAAIHSGDVTAFTDADIAFHAELLIGSGNRILAQISGAVEAALRAREDLHLLPDHLGPETVASHEAITDAIEAGSPGKAEKATRALIRTADDEITEQLYRHGARPIRGRRPAPARSERLIDD
ncbi:MAG: FCD domain-containing protein [Terracoccus sp.]